jgi:tetratricopeptide (TPR) repeat protein
MGRHCLPIALVIGCFHSLPAQAAFLDFSPPARSSGMGGNLVADPQGSESLYFNPAGLGSTNRFDLSARYQALEPGLEGDSLSTSGLAGALPLESAGTAGFSWDHFGSNNLQQDRFRLSWGRDFPELKSWGDVRVGFSFSYLKQAFILSAPLSGLTGSNFSASAFSLGAGVLYKPFPSLTLGASADDLTQPNLGVIGIDRFAIAWRWGAAYEFSMGGAGSLVATLSQADLGEGLETQGGGEWRLPFLNLALRGGGDSDQGSLGLGWGNSFLQLDYAYLFSWGGAPSLGSNGLPANYVFELTFLGPGPAPSASPSLTPYAWFVGKGHEAFQAKTWRWAVWYDTEAMKLQPGDPAVAAEKETALQNYNRERAAQYFAMGQSAENQGSLIEAQRDDAWAAQLDPGQPQYQQAADRLKNQSPPPRPAALSDPKVQDLISRVLELLAKGEKKKAAGLLAQAQGLHPGDPLLDHLAQSLSATEASPAANPQVDQLLLEADLYTQKGRSDLARQDWKKVLALDPANPRAKDGLDQGNGGGEKALTPEENQRAQDLYQKGLQAYLSGDMAEAVKDWQETLTIDPHNVNALNNLVRAKLESGESAP